MSQSPPRNGGAVATGTTGAAAMGVGRSAGTAAVWLSTGLIATGGAVGAGVAVGVMSGVGGNVGALVAVGIGVVVGVGAAADVAGAVAVATGVDVLVGVGVGEVDAPQPATIMGTMHANASVRSRQGIPRKRRSIHGRAIPFNLHRLTLPDYLACTIVRTLRGRTNRPIYGK